MTFSGRCFWSDDKVRGRLEPKLLDSGVLFVPVSGTAAKAFGGANCEVRAGTDSFFGAERAERTCVWV